MTNQIVPQLTYGQIADIASSVGLTSTIERHDKAGPHVQCSWRVPGAETLMFRAIIGEDGFYVRLLGEVEIGELGWINLANAWNASATPITPAVPISTGYVLTHCTTFRHGITTYNFARVLRTFAHAQGQLRERAVEAHADARDAASAP
ncbi:MAG: hypothetical protein P0Y50_06065 [Candidatus Brevundimonas colombiensis]|uniref:Uncharacterized protein n=1 Tax=Candidatus Brevundimonas colombiensis TaxID=3121376 RepID=A0AAJ5X1C6_9CAUL|nr:hypothetical protein [Brevundimonas sp.]WEK41169.1 MAG: hypothetical protein P0Y50_06065 [Brevundimonas sp.]